MVRSEDVRKLNQEQYITSTSSDSRTSRRTSWFSIGSVTTSLQGTDTPPEYYIFNYKLYTTILLLANIIGKDFDNENASFNR